MLTYLIAFLFACIGLAIQSLAKINAINLRSTDEFNFSNILKSYFKEDFAKIGMALLSFPVILAGVDGYLNLRAAGQEIAIPGATVALQDKIIYGLNAVMGIWGYTAGSIVMAFGTITEKRIQKITKIYENTIDPTDTNPKL